QKFRNGEDFDLCNIHFTQQFIEIEVAGIIKGKKHQIAWSDVNTHNYQTYFMVYSDKNPTDISTMYKYRDDWNIAILYSVLRTILRD
ncbi:hypothetical protein Q0P57_13855, partial [Staphylococcus aureus]|nr:hypothetical protein [Staphylococcus aureus]